MADADASLDELIAELEKFIDDLAYYSSPPSHSREMRGNWLAKHEDAILAALKRCRDAERERDAATHASINLDDFRVIVGHIRGALEKPDNRAAVSLGRAALRTLEFHDPRFIESEQARLMAESRSGE